MFKPVKKVHKEKNKEKNKYRFLFFTACLFYFIVLNNYCFSSWQLYQLYKGLIHKHLKSQKSKTVNTLTNFCGKQH